MVKMTGKQGRGYLSSGKTVWKNSKLTKLITLIRAFDITERFVVIL